MLTVIVKAIIVINSLLSIVIFIIGPFYLVSWIAKRLIHRKLTEEEKREIGLGFEPAILLILLFALKVAGLYIVEDRSLPDALVELQLIFVNIVPPLWVVLMVRNDNRYSRFKKRRAAAPLEELKEAVMNSPPSEEKRSGKPTG